VLLILIAAIGIKLRVIQLAAIPVVRDKTAVCFTVAAMAHQIYRGLTLPLQTSCFGQLYTACLISCTFKHRHAVFTQQPHVSTGYWLAACQRHDKHLLAAVAV